MNLLRPALAIVFLAASSALSQTPSPSPTPPPAEDGEVVKISTAIVRLDVTVTDKRGRVIRDLRPEEFEIYQNGKKQKVENVTFISSVREEDEAGPKPAKPDPLAAPTPPPVVRAENVRRTLALVVDDLALNFHSAYQVRRALRKFVDEEMREGDLAAIIRTGAGIGALQQFTSDKRILYAAIERVKWNPLGRAGISTFAPIEPSMLEQAAALGDSTVTAEDLEQERNFNNSVEDYRSSVFATGTLGALRYIVEGMGQLPGRKSVVLFSEGFSIFQRDSQGFSDGGRVVDSMLRLVDAANRASVVFYAIDPRGLEYTGPTAADRIIDPSPQAVSRIYSDRSNQLFQSQAGIDYLSKETGGFAVLGMNDISWAIRKVMNDQSYYLIAYEPDSDTFDPKRVKYNDIEIKVSRKDTDVRYRSGFINIAEEAMAKRAPVERSPVYQIQSALISPFAVNDISLSLNSLYGNDPTIGNYVRSLVHIPAKDLKFIDGPNGTKQA
ncbi:MAG: VWA domain-containing protein, partial [Pyrinomonadaceae bacterium]|nr:VWA domain-containing protein [Pyrinomonadaceae bacterium]